MISYGFKKELSISVEECDDKVALALKTEGFGIFN